MPLAHFVNSWWNQKPDPPIYAPMKVLSFNDYESKEVIFSKNFFLFYPYGNIEKDKYLNQLKTITFKEDDGFREILLKQKPHELKYKVYDKEGELIRELTMYETEYEQLSEYEISIKFKNFEDKYF